MRLPATFLVAALAIGSCRCEQRSSDIVPSTPHPARLPAVSPGPGSTPRDTLSPPISPRVESDPRNASAVSDGMRLFRSSCNGCHSNGAGVGPSFKNHAWIYGGEPDDIFHSISRGRPNGMPGFGRRMTEQQIWHLVAYIRAVSSK